MILKINTNLLLGIFVIALFIGLLIVVFIIILGKPSFEPKEQEDLELEQAYINQIEVKNAKIQKATETHNVYGKIEDNE